MADNAEPISSTPNHEVIASRVLRLRGEDSSIYEVIVAVRRPFEDDGAWMCPIEIGWPDGPKRMNVGGLDSVQALFLALQIIGTLLYTSSRHRDGQLWWETPGDGYGFPVPHGLRDMLVGQDREPSN